MGLTNILGLISVFIYKIRNKSGLVFQGLLMSYTVIQN